MALHLITGYAGQEHITSADQGAYNMGTFGEGEFVLDRGSKFAATVVTNNQITIANGEALMQGRFIKLAVGTTESVTIDNGSSGMKRKDLIVLRYSKDAGTGIESVALAVKKGTPDASSPSDPAVTTGTITDGTDLVNEMKLYRVNLDGLNIVSVDTLFSVKTTMVEYMDEYQLPVADADTLGGVKAYSEEQVNTSTRNDTRVYIDSNNQLKLGKSTIWGEVPTIDSVFDLQTALSISAGISVILSSVTISLTESSSNTFRSDLTQYRKFRTSASDRFSPRAIIFRTSNREVVAYVIFTIGMKVPQTGAITLMTPIILYNPNSASKTASEIVVYW